MKTPIEHLNAFKHIHKNDIRFYVHWELSCLLAEFEHLTRGAIENELQLILANLSDYHWKDAPAFAEEQT